MQQTLISLIRSALSQWDVGPNSWTLTTALSEIVAKGCPVGAKVAYRVWHMFRTF